MLSVCDSLPKQAPITRIPIGMSAVLLNHTQHNVRAQQATESCISILEPYFELIALDLDTLIKPNAALNLPICGYIDAPSNNPNSALQNIRKKIEQCFPLLPIEEIDHLSDETQREHFVMQICAYHDWQQLRSQSSLSAKDLIDFHSRYKYLVMAHSSAHYHSMGRLLGNLRNQDLEQIAAAYFQQLMDALSTPATRKMHSNTLMHLQGYLKKILPANEKAELTALIHQYRQGQVPLVVPIARLKQHLSVNPELLHYALNQVYLNPHALSLRH